jgi:hypothetical protein
MALLRSAASLGCIFKQCGRLIATTQANRNYADMAFTFASPSEVRQTRKLLELCEKMWQVYQLVLIRDRLVAPPTKGGHAGTMIKGMQCQCQSGLPGKEILSLSWC